MLAYGGVGEDDLVSVVLGLSFLSLSLVEGAPCPTATEAVVKIETKATSAKTRMRKVIGSLRRAGHKQVGRTSEPLIQRPAADGGPLNIAYSTGLPHFGEGFAGYE